MKKLLVAVDFSKSSSYAVEYASWLGLRLQADLTALHVSGIIRMEETVSEKVRREFQEKREQSLLQQLLRFTSPYPNKAEEALSAVGRIDCRVRRGEVVEELIAGAQQINADLIIVGTRAKHQLWDHLFGSVTTALIARSPIPVLVIPEGAAYCEVQRIAFASEITLDERRVFEWLHGFAERLSAEVERFYVNILPEEQDKWKEEIIRQTWPEDAPPRAERLTMIRERSVLKGIDYYLEKYPSEMLALYVPQRAFPERLLHKSLSKQLAYRTNIPMLVFKA